MLFPTHARSTLATPLCISCRSPLSQESMRDFGRLCWRCFQAGLGPTCTNLMHEDRATAEQRGREAERLAIGKQLTEWALRYHKQGDTDLAMFLSAVALCVAGGGEPASLRDTQEQG